MKTIKECQLEINENASFPLKKTHAYLEALKDVLGLIDEFEKKIDMMGVHGDNCRCPIRINEYTINKIKEDIKELKARIEG